MVAAPPAPVCSWHEVKFPFRNIPRQAAACAVVPAVELTSILSLAAELSFASGSVTVIVTVFVFSSILVDDADTVAAVVSNVNDPPAVFCETPSRSL